MALETGTYISDLVTTNPAGTDLEKQGDDHLRLIKATLKATFLDTFTAGLYLPKFTATADALVAKWLGAGITQNLSIINGRLSLSVGSSALTIALVTESGANPSATEPVYVLFRNATIGADDLTVLTITSALSLVISSGSTMGTSNSTAFRLWIGICNDAGTARLCAVNARSGNDIMYLRDDVLYSSTAEGGAGAADSAQVIYSGTAFTSKAVRWLGYAEWGSGLATAGTWASTPTKIQQLGPGVSRPGDVVQVRRTDTTAGATGTTILPPDDTIPQNTEGDQYMSQAITPNSAANVLFITTQASLASTTAQRLGIALFQDTTANALTGVYLVQTTANAAMELTLNWRQLAGTTSSTTFKVRGGNNLAGTTTFNGEGGSRTLGGVKNSFIEVQEIMA